jgi:DNA-binding protein YbaB
VDRSDWAAGRPNWNIVTEMLGELRKATAAVPETQRRMMQVTGVAWSDDRMIKAVVGPRGHLLELDIDPRALRKPSAKALSAEIVATVRLAVEDAAQRAKAIFEEALPTDIRQGGMAGGLDFTKMAFSHDADVRSKDDDETRA